MPSQSASGDNVPRRQFLKIAGATSVTLGLAGCASDDGDGTPTQTETPEPTTEEPPEELPEPEVVGETVRTANTTDHYGPAIAHVNDEDVVHSMSYFEEDYLKPSNKGPGYRDRLYAPARIKYPMKRKGWEPGGDSSGEGRGKEEFVRISWDEAYDLMAEEYQRIIDEYGNEAIFGGSYGWGSAGALGNGRANLHRFLALNGGYINDSENYSLAAQMVAAPYTFGTSYPQGHNFQDVKENSELVIWWASDANINGDIASESTKNDFLKDLEEAGVEQVYINPRVTDSQVFTDAELIDIRMNTDTAMMAAMGYVYLDEDLHDQEFLDEYTVGFDEFESYLMGEDDGQPKTPEWAEEITGVPADTIRDLAHRTVENRTLFTQGWGLNRGDHGEQPVRMMAAIAAMVGDIGLPGGGANYALHYAGTGQPSAKGSGPGGFPVPSNPVGGERLSDTSIPLAKIADMLLNPGEEYPYDGQTWTYPDIELIHWVGGNPFHHHQDTNKLIEAWQKPEAIFVNEINWTPTAEFADIVLPACTRLEAEDIMGHGRAVIANQKAVDPIFESKADYDIFRELADKMGIGLRYTEGNSRMDWIESFFESTDVPMSFDEFWEEGYYTYEVEDEPSTAYSSWREDPDENPMGTPSGLLEITSPRLKEYDLDDCPAVPKWLEPDEWLGDEKTSEYPFHMMTPHPKHRLHSEFDNVPMLRKHSKVANREPVWINARDAAEKGIEDGDVVRLWNDLGETLAGAVVTERIKPDHVALSYGSWYEPEEPGEIGTMDLDGNANMLCQDNHTSSLAQGPDGKSQLVNIEKYEGDL